MLEDAEIMSDAENERVTLELRAAVNNYINLITPPGTRLINVATLTPEIKLVLCCDGSDVAQGLWCNYKPGHHGECGAMREGHTFTRTN